jgi:hypothetical protein
MAYGIGTKDYMGSKFKIATTVAKSKGYKSFTKGSAGYTRRNAIAEAVARRVKK